MKSLEKNVYLLLFLILTILFAWHVYFVMRAIPVDFVYHVEWTRNMQQGSSDVPVNPLFEVLAAGLAFLLPIEANIEWAVYLLMVFFHVLTGILIYRLYLHPSLSEVTKRDDAFVSVFMTLALVLSSAIIFFGWPSRNLYITNGAS